MIHYVAAGKDALHGGVRAVMDDDVAVLIQVELVAEDLRVGRVPDRDEDTIALDLLPLSALSVFQDRRAHLPVVTCQDIHELPVEQPLDLLIGLAAVHHDLRRAELLAPVNDPNPATKTG